MARKMPRKPKPQPHAPTGGGTLTLLTPNPTFGEPVTFAYTFTGTLSGAEHLMIMVAAYQPDNPFADNDIEPGLVYRELALPDALIVLGAGSSAWVQGGGGPAHCAAELWVYGGLGPDIQYAVPGTFIEFDAAG